MSLRLKFLRKGQKLHFICLPDQLEKYERVVDRNEGRLSVMERDSDGVYIEVMKT